MNYYERHIGDYLKDTAHLSLLEHGVYARLLDVYYTREQPFAPGEACRLVGARTKEERAAVESVLAEFFIDGRQARCDREIERYQARIEHNQRVGKLGGRPKKTQTQTEPEQNPPGSLREPKANPPSLQSPVSSLQSPVTNASEAIASGGKPPPMEPDEIIFGYGVPLLVNAGSADKAARSFLGGLRKQHGDAAVIDKLRDCIRAKPLQPLEWLAAALPPRGAKKAENKQEAIEARNRGVADEWASMPAGAAT